MDLELDYKLKGRITGCALAGYCIACLFLQRAYLAVSNPVINRAVQCELNQEFTASFSALPGLKFGTLAAAI